jgi:hypothetical protein
VSGVVVRKRPRPLGAAIAVGCGALAVAYLGTESAVRIGLAGQLFAIAVLYVGAERLRDGHRFSGGALSLVSLPLILAVAPALAAILGRPEAAIDVVPGVVGVAVLGVGVRSLSHGGSRWLVKLGTGLVFVAGLLSVLLNEAGFGALLVVVVLAVIAWDAGETAINVGRQLGREASAWRIQMVHVGATGLVGVGGIYLTRAADGIDAASASLPRLTAYVIAIVLLAVALHD